MKWWHLVYSTMYESYTCPKMLKNVCQPSCIARRNQYSGHFSGREIQVFILNP